jgi:hypothetical protein
MTGVTVGLVLVGIGVVAIGMLQKVLRLRGQDKGTVSSEWLAHQRGTRDGSGK